MPAFAALSAVSVYPSESGFSHESNRGPIRDGRTGARRFWNVPNTLTVSRLALAVCVFVLIEYESLLLGAGVVRDRRGDRRPRRLLRPALKQDTPIGRQLDPLIDKVIVSGCYIYLATIPGTGVMPWMVTAIVVRELLIQGLRSHLEGQGQAFGARMAGKLKTVVQCLSISAVLLCLGLEPSFPGGLAPGSATP